MPTDITLVMPYYDNAQMLSEHFRLIRDLSNDIKERLSVVIVDDCSPNAPAQPQDIHVPLQIYRLKKDVRWNQDACRNIGVKHAPTDWVLLTDIDHLVPRKTFKSLTGKEWDPDNAYSFSRVSAPGETPYKPHPNSWFLNKKLFNQIGGYDERFAGYYGTDGDFKVRLLERAKEWVKLNELLIRVPRDVIPDASTTTYTRKEPWDAPEVYRRKKARDAVNAPPLRDQFEYERVA